MISVLDASAVLRWIDKEAGAKRVAEILDTSQVNSDRILLSALHYGEVLVALLKRNNPDLIDELKNLLQRLSIEIVSATAESAESAAILKSTYKLPYVDAFGAALTESSHDATLITADFDFKVVEHLISIEFLPHKPLTTTTMR